MIKNLKLRKEILSQIESESMKLNSTYSVVSILLFDISDCIIQFNGSNKGLEFELWAEYYAWELLQGEIRSRINMLQNRLAFIRGF